MRKFWLSFSMMAILTVFTIFILLSVNPNKEKEMTIATQGVRLISSVAVNSNTNDATAQVRLTVGNLLLGSNNQIFRVNEIRKTQDDNIYLVVSWKFLTRYDSYQEFVSDPYMNYKTYEIRSFMYDKKIITENDITNFYNKNIKMLAIMREVDSTQRDVMDVLHNRVVAQQQQESPNPNAPQLSEQLRSLRNSPTVLNSSSGTTPQNYDSSSSRSTQAYSTTDIVLPTNDNASDQQQSPVITEEKQ